MKFKQSMTFLVAAASALIAGSAMAGSYSFTPIVDPASAPGNTGAAAINAAGEIVGSYTDASGGTYGFTDVAGTFTTISGATADPLYGTVVTGINNAGTIVGSYADAQINRFNFLDKGGVVTSLGNDPHATSDYTYPQSVNDAGVVAGYYFLLGGGPILHGFVEQSGSFEEIDDPAGLNGTSSVHAINDAGTLAGDFRDATGIHGFIDQGGVFTTIDDPLASPGSTEVEGMNNKGELVGVYVSGAYDHGFLDDNGVFTTIDDPLDTMSSTFLSGINDNGQIVGEYTGADGVSIESFVATPTAGVPEPNTWAVMLIGLAGIGGSLRLRQRRFGRISHV